MYLIVIGWLYVVFMMAVAEATNTTGSLLGAIFTFLLYGLGPVALVVYIMRTPARKQAIRHREAAARQQQEPRELGEPDARGEATADTVAPVRKEP